MTEPLDFTAAGRKRSAEAAPNAQPPKKAPKRAAAKAQPPERQPFTELPPAKRSRQSHSTNFVVAAVVVVVVAGAAVGAYVLRRKTPPPSAAARAAVVANFCGEVQTVDAEEVSNGVISVSGKVSGSAAAIARLFRITGPTIDAMQTDAPGEVRGDVNVVVQALKRAQAGDPSAVLSASFTASNTRLTTYVRTKCSSGTSGQGS